MDDVKTLKADDYLLALVLFTFATEYYRQCRGFEKALAERFGVSLGELNGSHIGDAIYSDGEVSFDEALRKQQIIVEWDRTQV
jgi:aromatic ring-cleaving dioxygenase